MSVANDPGVSAAVSKRAVTDRFPSRRQVIAVVLLLAIAVYLRPYAVALFSPGSAREVLADLSHLTIPDTVYDARTTNRSSLDADVWAVARLAPADCQRALSEAPSRGFKPVPWPQNENSAPLGEDVPAPTRGWYWAEDTRFADPTLPQPPGKRHAQLAWIDANTCRVFASYSSGG